MTIAELHNRLVEFGVPTERFSLNGLYGSTNDNEKWGLLIKNGKHTTEFEVYYRERGEKHSKITFTEESEACDYLFKRIRDDWFIDRINEIDGFNGMTVNERLYESGYMDEFDLCKTRNKTRAEHILRMLRVDEPSIRKILE